MSRIARPIVLAGALALGACAATPPAGPSVMALPGKGKSFEAFRQDDTVCRQYASQQIGNSSPTAAANHSAITSTAVGTVLGAAAGAAIGAATGNPAAGAAIGAGSGLVLGGAAGAGAAELSASQMQRLYDIGYIQCMTAKGENVPQTLPTYAYGAPAYVYPYPAYGYPYYPYYYGPGYYGPAYVGFGFGWHHWHH